MFMHLFSNIQKRPAELLLCSHCFVNIDRCGTHMCSCISRMPTPAIHDKWHVIAHPFTDAQCGRQINYTYTQVSQTPLLVGRDLTTF